MREMLLGVVEWLLWVPAVLLGAAIGCFAIGIVLWLVDIVSSIIEHTMKGW